MSTPPMPGPDEFLAKCKRRFGAANPERVASPVWEWMVRTRHTPFSARQELGLAPDYGCCGEARNPDWCFVRMGAAVVELGDGRRLSIAGEHEDWYDPDFCIYNDVVVEQGGRVEILCYPREEFPPTDFHTATLIGELVWIVGSLGYPEDRASDGGATPVFVLDTRTYRVQRIAVEGPSPLRLHKHRARLLADGFTIEVTGGTTTGSVNGKTVWRTHTDVHHLDTRRPAWRLHTDTSGWRQIRIRFDQEIDPVNVDAMMSWYTGDALRGLPYPLTPAAAPETDEESGRDRVHTLTVGGVPVRVTDGYGELEVIVEGELPAEAVDKLLGELCSLLNATRRPVTEVVRS